MKMWLQVVCLVGYTLAVPVPQGLTLKDFAADARPNGARSLGGNDFRGVLISSSYSQVRRQGRRGETTNIKFPTLTVENPNILSIGSPIQKVTNENGPVYNNLLSTKDIEGKIREINQKEEEKRAEQIIKDIELLEEVSLLEEVVELEKEAEEELIELGQIEFNPKIIVEEIPERDIMHTDGEFDSQRDILYPGEEADIKSDILYSDEATEIQSNEELDIPVIVEEEPIGNLDILEVSPISPVPEEMIDLVDLKVIDFSDEVTKDLVDEINAEVEASADGQDVSNPVPNIDFGLIQEV